MIYTHHHCLFVVASEFTFLLAYCAWEFHRGSSQARVLIVRSLVAAAGIAVAYVPSLLLMLRQLGRVQENYWTAPLSVELIERTFLEFISPLTQVSDPSFWGGTSLAVFVLAAATLAFSANREELLVLTVAVLPMVFAAVVTVVVSRVWEGRFFRFSQLFLLFVLALAVSKIVPWRRIQGAALAALVLGTAAASVDFWYNRRIPTHPGMRGAMERILSQYKGKELIVADSIIHFYPAKYYAPQGVPVRIRESATNGFWSHQSLRPGDVLSEPDFRAAMAEGIWFLSHRDVSGSDDGLADAIVDARFESRYDFGVNPWTVYVSHLRVPDETAKVDEAIARISAGVSSELDLTRSQRLAEYLPRVSRLPTLRRIRLDATALNNEQLRQIAKCGSLCTLSLVNTQVTDDGIPAIENLRKLETLNLDFNAVGDRGFQVVAGLPALVELSLGYTRVSDNGLVYLERAKKLRRLNLEGTAVTDRGVARLECLTELEDLNLADTAVTESAAERLRRIIPRLRVIHK